MLQQLPESRRRRERHPVVAVASVIAHVAVLALVLTQAPGDVDASAPDPEVVKPIYTARPSSKPTPVQHAAGGTPGPVEGGFVVPAPTNIDFGIPPVDPGAAATPDDVFASARRGTGAGPALGEGATVTGSVFTLDLVEKAAVALPGTPAPRYPELLRAAGVEGAVVARFVVDSAGRVESGSFTVLASDDERFTAAVRATLPGMRFLPAELGGRRVRQLVEQRFDFALHRPAR